MRCNLRSPSFHLPSCLCLLSSIFYLLSPVGARAADSQALDSNLRDSATGSTAVQKLHDNGDGTKSLVTHPDSSGGGGSGGDASAANQTAVQANPGSDATKATAVQGVTGGKAVPVSGTVTATGPLTDTQLRATAVPVSGTFWQATQPVSGTVTATGPLTDTQLRATAVPVSLGAQRTPTIVAHTTDGTVAAGCRSLVFIASSDYAGTILTNFTLPAGAGLTVPVPTGDTLAAVAYTVTAGTLYSVEVR
jgi:hypothetical protein